MKPHRLVFGSVFLVLACLFFSACPKPADPRTTAITATTPEEFDAWKNALAQKIPQPEMQEFETCLNEIRLGIMQRKEAGGVGPIAQKLCDYVDGKTLREVLVMGYGSTVDWVTKELALQRSNTQKAEEALNGPGSEQAKARLRAEYNFAKDNIAKLEARREKAKARLAELQAATPSRQAQ